MKTKKIIIGTMIFFLIVISILVFFEVTENHFDTICTKKEGELPARREVILWNGQNTFLGHKEYPVSIVWFRESARNLWTPHKGFNQASEIKSIINLLNVPEVNDPIPELRTRNKLSLIYYLGEPAFLRIVELYFDIDDGIFTGPKGKSQELGKVLVAKEESGLARYRYHVPPYDEEFIKRAKESERRLREAIAKHMAEKEAEAQGKIEEANKPK